MCVCIETTAPKVRIDLLCFASHTFRAPFVSFSIHGGEAMKKKLLFGVVLLVMGYAAGQVMSQSTPVPVSQRARQNRPTPNSKPSIVAQVQAVREHLVTSLERDPGGTSSVRDSQLIKALDNYLAADRLSEIVTTLEEFVAISPGTDEATRAAKAIQILKNEAEGLAPTPATALPLY